MASLCTTSLDEFAPSAVSADTPAFSLYASAQTLARIGASTQDRSRGYSRDVIVEKRAPGRRGILGWTPVRLPNQQFRVESPDVRMSPRVRVFEYEAARQPARSQSDRPRSRLAASGDLESGQRACESTPRRGRSARHRGHRGRGPGS